MRANITELNYRMTPIRSGLSSGLCPNQASNGVHPVRLKISAEICRGAEV